MNETDATILPVRHRLRYTIDSSLYLSILLLGLVGFVILLGVFIFVQLGTRTEPQYFKLTENLQIITPAPLDQEGISKPALLNWVNEALSTAFSFNYSNIYKQQSRLTPYFGNNAMQVYLDMLKLDEDFIAVSTKFYVVAILPTATPEILTSKAFKGRYAWQIRVPVQIRFSNAVTLLTQDVELQFLVWRVPETESAMGITIAALSKQVKSRSGRNQITTSF